MGMVAILVIWPGPNMLTFSPNARRLHMKFNWIPPVVSEEKSFEDVDGWQTTVATIL